MKGKDAEPEISSPPLFSVCGPLPGLGRAWALRPSIWESDFSFMLFFGCLGLNSLGQPWTALEAASLDSHCPFY